MVLFFRKSLSTRQLAYVEQAQTMDGAQLLQHDSTNWVIHCFWVIYNQADLHMIPSQPTLILLIENEQECILAPFV
jgi:hypothetical protein